MKEQNGLRFLLRRFKMGKIHRIPQLPKRELTLVKKLAEISNKKNLFGTEEELFILLKSLM